jgi:hypothetical protein
MGERKHGDKGKEKKVIQAKREEEMLSSKHPAEALRQVKDGPPSTLKPAKILALQRTVGNRVVQRLITKQSQPGVLQRHVPPEADAAFTTNAAAGVENWASMGTKVKGAKTNISEAIELANTQVEHDNAIINAFKAAKAYEPESGGETQSPQAGEDIYEGGGGSQSTQGGEDIYEGGGE